MSYARLSRQKSPFLLVKKLKNNEGKTEKEYIFIAPGEFEGSFP